MPTTSVTMKLVCAFAVLVGASIFSLTEAQFVDPNWVTYQLFQEESPNDAITIRKNTIAQHIDESVSEVIFFIHGYMDSRNVPWYKDLKNAYLSSQNGTKQVIEVDWSLPAAGLYLSAVPNARIVAGFIADLIVELNSNSTFKISDVKLVGHSLGAQVAGFVGKKLQSELNFTLSTIVALDAAGPDFSGMLVGDANRLAKTDANVVVAIHTDGGDYGYLAAIGSIDVFVNGGTAIQPGCPDILLGDIDHCSHKRSFRFYVDAVARPNTLVATECGNYWAYLNGNCANGRQIDIGAKLEAADQGTYYLQTNRRVPYGQGPRK